MPWYNRLSHLPLMKSPYGFTEIAEKANGRFAMIGLVAALGAYAVTGQILPGLF